MAREDILKDVGMDDLKTIDDVEKFWQLAHEKYPEMIGFSRGGMNPMNFKWCIRFGSKYLQIKWFCCDRWQSTRFRRSMEFL